MGSWLPWRKLASNPPGLDWPALPWQSRGLYALLLGLANDLGRIPLGRLGLPSLAGGLNAQWSEIEPCFSALLAGLRLMGPISTFRTLQTAREQLPQRNAWLILDKGHVTNRHLSVTHK